METWLIRRLSPESNPIEISDLHKERNEEQLLYAMGSEAANVHVGLQTLSCQHSARPAAQKIKLVAFCRPGYDQGHSKRLEEVQGLLRPNRLTTSLWHSAISEVETEIEALDGSGRQSRE